MTTSANDHDKTVHGPTYWFVALDTALEDGDWPEAARAADELSRLGIDVRIRLHRGEPDEAEVGTC